MTSIFSAVFLENNLRVIFSNPREMDSQLEVSVPPSVASLQEAESRARAGEARVTSLEQNEQTGLFGLGLAIPLPMRDLNPLMGPIETGRTLKSFLLLHTLI